MKNVKSSPHDFQDCGSSTETKRKQLENKFPVDGRISKGKEENEEEASNCFDRKFSYFWYKQMNAMSVMKL